MTVVKRNRRKHFIVGRCLPVLLFRDSTVGGAMRIMPFLSVFFMVACSGLEKVISATRAPLVRTPSTSMPMPMPMRDNDADADAERRGRRCRCRQRR